MLSGSLRRAACSTAYPSTSVLIRWMWCTSHLSMAHTWAPRRGTTSIRPVASSERMASRTGLRLTPRRSAS